METSDGLVIMYEGQAYLESGKVIKWKPHKKSVVCQALCPHIRMRTKLEVIKYKNLEPEWSYCLYPEESLDGTVHKPTCEGDK